MGCQSNKWVLKSMINMSAVTVSQLSVEVLVVRGRFTEEVLENTLGKSQVFLRLLQLPDILVNDADVPDGHCSIGVVIVAIVGSKDLHRLVVMSNG